MSERSSFDRDEGHAADATLVNDGTEPIHIGLRQVDLAPRNARVLQSLTFYVNVTLRHDN